MFSFIGCIQRAMLRPLRKVRNPQTIIKQTERTFTFEKEITHHQGKNALEDMELELRGKVRYFKTKSIPTATFFKNQVRENGVQEERLSSHPDQHYAGIDIEKEEQLEFATKKRKLVTNGPLSSSTDTLLLDPSFRNESSIIPTINRGGSFLFHGEPSSGKTTCILKAMQQLEKDHVCLMVSMRSLERCQTNYYFWKSLSQALRVFNPSHTIPEFSSELDFLDAMSIQKINSTWNGKKVVLFFDDLNETSQEIGQFLNSAVRSINQHSHLLCIQAVVGVTHSGQIGSGLWDSFDFAESIENTFWTHHEVASMVDLVAEENETVIDPKVAADLFFRTSGNPRLVNLCLHLYLTKIVSQSNLTFSDLRYQEWVHYANHDLIQDLLPYFNSMFLNDKSESVLPEIINLLNPFDSTPEPMSIEIRMLNDLVMRGILHRNVTENSYSVSSPIMWHIMQKKNEAPTVQTLDVYRLFARN